MTSRMKLVFPAIVLISACVFGVAQEQPPASGECVPRGEPVYNAEKDKVKPLKLATSQREQLPPEIRRNTWLELLVNSDGRLCTCCRRRITMPPCKSRPTWPSTGSSSLQFMNS